MDDLPLLVLKSLITILPETEITPEVSVYPYLAKQICLLYASACLVFAFASAICMGAKILRVPDIYGGFDKADIFCFKRLSIGSNYR